MSINYILISQVLFDLSGKIVGGVVSQNGIKPNASYTGQTTNIYALQQQAFGNLKSYLSSVSQNMSSGTSSISILNGNPILSYTDQALNTYLHALSQVIQYNCGTSAINGSGSPPTSCTAPSGGNNMIVMSTSITNINDVLTQYNKVLEDRQRIREMMNEINLAPGTLNADYTHQYTSGLYVNTLVAILATSLLYLFFIKLK